MTVDRKTALFFELMVVDRHEPGPVSSRRTSRSSNARRRRSASATGSRRALRICVTSIFPTRRSISFWCESAIYVVGFDTALRAWRRVLARRGHMAVSEVCWTRRDPPGECVAFWEEMYPSIRGVSELLETIAACGYETIGHFMLPPAAWWDNYYGPFERNLDAFERRYLPDADAHDLARHLRREIEMWRAYSNFYGYPFFVMRTGASV